MSEYDRLKKQKQDILARQATLEHLALRNCLALATRMAASCPSLEWQSIIRYCNAAGVSSTLLRDTDEL